MWKLLKTGDLMVIFIRRKRKLTLLAVGRQSSQEQEIHQLKRELYDIKEREADLKDQLKFVEEETKAMRKKALDLEDENENLSTQLKKMSIQQAIVAKKVTGSDDNSDVIISEAEIELKVQFELTEQELSVLKKKMMDTEEENEMLHSEVFSLEKQLKEKDVLLKVLPEPSSPNAYYEDKIKEYEKAADEFRSKLLEKDKEIEQLYGQMKCIRERRGNLKKSKSLDLDSDYDHIVDLKRQLELTQQESVELRDKLIDFEEENEKLRIDNERLKSENRHHSPPTLSALAVAYVDTEETSHLTGKISQLEAAKDSLTEKITALAEKLSPFTQTASNQTHHQTPCSIPAIVEPGVSCDQSQGESHDFSKTYYFTRSPSTSSKPISCDTESNLGGVAIIREQGNKKSRDILGSRDPQLLLEYIDGYISQFVKQTRMMDAEEFARVSSSGNHSGEGGNEVSPEVRTIKTESPEFEQTMSSATDSGMSSAEDSEHKEALMDRILDLEEEVEDLRLIIRTKEEKNLILESEVKDLEVRVREVQNEARRRELELLQDMDMMQDKNEILSNLLDIVKDRAEAAEEELERVVTEINEGEESSVSSGSSQSASAVSALSGASVGSDDVFDGSPSEKTQVITKEWEDQFRKRINCLERLLAEERGKVAAAEKKLKLVGNEALSSAMSDDVKLHLREKELLQTELRESQKHVRIASDQVRGLTEKLKRVETERYRSPKLLRRKCLNLSSEDLPQFGLDEEQRFKLPCPQCLEMKKVREECQKYKQKAEELEIKVEEINEIWVSKSAASEKEKQSLEDKAKYKTVETKKLEETITKMKEDIRRKDIILKERDIALKEKLNIIARKEELIQEQEEIIKQREEDLQSLLDLISQRERTIREMNEQVRARDERLKEKDELIQKLNSAVDEKNEELTFMEEEIQDSTNKRKESETLILEMQEIISESKKGDKSELENENERLQSDIENLMSNVTDLHGEKTTLQTELDKAKHALSEAMLMWDRDRSTTGAELNTIREKLRLYDQTAGKKDSQIVHQFRKETHEILEQKEKLANELRINRMEHDNAVRILKHERFKLTEELTSKIRMLTNEITNNDKMSDELVKLRAQDDVADQLRHHEKILRAEYMAMKVRYETQLDRLQKEHLKLLTVTDRLMREKNLDQEIIVGVQKSMQNIRETYTHDLSRWRNERDVLEKHIKEIDEGKELAKHLRSQVDGLKEQITEQEVERSDLVNKMTTERKSWDIEKANLNSKINQLEEKLAIHVQAQSKSQDIQYRMEVTWEKERAEQKRLLTEAHRLALDLQDQLQKRDTEHARERKNLMEQLENEKSRYTDARNYNEKQSLEVQTCEVKVKDVEKKMEELKEKQRKEQDFWGREKADLLRRLAEMRKMHNRDIRRIDDVLTGLKRLRELASMIVESDTSESLPSDGEGGAGAVGDASAASSSDTTEINGEVGLSDLKQNIDQVILKYVKESLKQIHFAAEDLARPAVEISKEEKQKMRRSLSSSELEFLKEEFLLGPAEAGKILSYHETIPEVKSQGIDREHVYINRRITHDGSAIPSNLIQPDFIDNILKEQSSYYSETKGPDTLETHRVSLSREITKTDTQISRLPKPPPSFIIPRSRSSSPSPHSIELLPSERTRPTIYKSLSVDTSHRLSAPPGDPTARNYSSSPSPASADNFITAPLPNGHALEPNLPGAGVFQTGSLDRLSPNAARRRFFEAQPSSSVTYMSWPERNKRMLQEDRSLSNSSEFQSSVESEPRSPTRRTLKPSLSLDESSIQGVESDTSSSRGRTQERKDRRQLKKSQSVDAGEGKHSGLKDMFAAMKRKFRSKGLKRSHSARDEIKPEVEVRSTRPIAEQLDGERMSIQENMTPVTMPEHPADPRRSRKEQDPSKSSATEKGDNSKKSAQGSSKPQKKKRFRSKSADRVVKPSHPILVHSGSSKTMVADAAWYFSETRV